MAASFCSGALSPLCVEWEDQIHPIANAIKPVITFAIFQGGVFMVRIWECLLLMKFLCCSWVLSCQWCFLCVRKFDLRNIIYFLHFRMNVEFGCSWTTRLMILEKVLHPKAQGLSMNIESKLTDNPYIQTRWLRQFICFDEPMMYMYFNYSK